MLNKIKFLSLKQIQVLENQVGDLIYNVFFFKNMIQNLAKISLSGQFSEIKTKILQWDTQF
jgi:conjugal transfer/entry exclusion protein